MFGLKIDKVNAALVGAYIASDLLQTHVEKTKQAKLDAVNREFDAREQELKSRLAQLEAMKKQMEDDGHLEP